MSTPDRWVDRVERYLDYRRHCGFALAANGATLGSFARFADRAGSHTRLTVALIIAWSKTAKPCKPVTWTRRVQILRGFAQYWLRFDPMTEVPPPELFGSAPYHRPMPHIFSDGEIIALMKATRQLSSNYPLRQQTCRVLFGLLAATGLRISEALNLKRVDVDLQAGVLTVREGKCHKSRLVPLHQSNTVALRSYSQLRDRSVPRPAHSDRFFLFDHGRCVRKEAIRYALQSLCRRLDWHPRGDYRRHRVQDMRHTYIVHGILRFYRQGIPIDRKLLALHTYVGHANIEETYWYCSAIPELMNIAAERFRRHLRVKRL